MSRALEVTPLRIVTEVQEDPLNVWKHLLRCFLGFDRIWSAAIREDNDDRWLDLLDDLFDEPLAVLIFVAKWHARKFVLVDLVLSAKGTRVHEDRVDLDIVLESNRSFGS